MGAPPELHSQPCWPRHWVGAGRAEQSCPSERNWASKGPAEIPVGLRDWPHHGPGPLSPVPRHVGRHSPPQGQPPSSTSTPACGSPAPQLCQATCLSIFLSSFFFFFKLYLAALDLSCSMRDLRSSLKQVGSSSLTRDQTQVPCIGS